MKKSAQYASSWLLCGVLSGCASPAPIAAAPPAATSMPAQPSDEPPVASPEAAAEAAPAAAPSSEAESPPAASAVADPPPVDLNAESRNPSRPPIDIMTSADTAFLINYANSAAAETARRQCAQKFNDDDAARAQCASDARDAFKPDVIRFKKAGAHWAWTVYKRTGSRLDELTTSRVELSEASPSSVKVKFVGGDKGMRPLLKDKREAIFTVPNDYSLEVTDTEWGKLVYEAKVGLIAN